MAARHRALAGALACAVAMSVFGTAQAADSDGQALFKDNCNSCHGDGSPNGEYTPMTLIQDQWTRFFERKFERTHKDVMDQEIRRGSCRRLRKPDDLWLKRGQSCYAKASLPQSQHWR